MKQKQLVIIATVCGVLCAVCVALFMVSVKGEADTARAEALARYGGEQVQVLVATRDVYAGERIDLSAVETRLWVADLLPENAVRDASDIMGRTATSTIFKGEVVTLGRFDANRESLDVPAGKQAVSVPAKAVQAVGGTIQAGMSVDVYSTGDTATTLIAQDVAVLDASVGSSGLSGDGGFITLALSPDRVQEIVAASSKSTLYFTLPGIGVAEEADTQGEDGRPDQATGSSNGKTSTSASASGKASGGER